MFRSLPKLSTQDEDGCGPGASLGTGLTHGHPQHCSGSATFEPIPHDHDFCERVTINVSITTYHYNIFFMNKLLNIYIHLECKIVNKYLTLFLFLFVYCFYIIYCLICLPCHIIIMKTLRQCLFYINRIIAQLYLKKMWYSSIQSVLLTWCVYYIRIWNQFMNVWFILVNLTFFSTSAVLQPLLTLQNVPRLTNATRSLRNDAYTYIYII